uniref:NADH dehydrogenase subunit 6 n=1 Tax=Harpactocrates apennicola TaxID=1110479 RepID=A0A516IMC9_9ARAC|nr:NADH dehydrogenase subunit 6 [Harpactocrates apennicola]QDP17927.1 NADH dehydrogenase subunit 6 [Harpactocrates apennicola]
MIILFFGLMFMLVDHPMSGIICVIMIILYYFMFMFLNSGAIWFGLVMLLVVLSGVMVLFTYMASLTPNEKFEVRMFWSGAIVFLMICLYLSDVSILGGEDTSLMSIKLWDLDIDVFMMFMLLVLLMVMLLVIEVVGKFLGPLRVD